MCEQLSELANICLELNAKLGDLPLYLIDEIRGELKELFAFGGRIIQANDCIHKSISLNKEDEEVYWVEIKSRDNPDIIRLITAKT